MAKSVGIRHPLIGHGIEPFRHKSFKFKMMKTVEKLLDWPPVWLAGALALAYALRHAGGGPLWARGLGLALVVAGLVLMAQSARQFRAMKTTIVPHRTPSALVTNGVYRFSRNPIYLADAAILLGAILYWYALAALILVPAFMAIIEWRFIRPEEERLRASFDTAFAAWEKRVRRWI
ncbi:isoprenylcysteine carboxylmethyltransferase family protein [Pseudorhodobacter turbinis]|uniref:Isoprenylcysteine carboxylmethyltransferase family protein n=1 Tax=Pseudorhodobacter turbinis TaxID=2500533 RepID=A0A4P8EDX4_9RHOB|nr:isoprenylcysteine carboxylmethyltransferase family protein [Pseudorhodobacter turbinis]